MEGSQPQELGEHRPLTGTTVLDFTSAWAGPMATRTLAYFGARVIKIEGPTKLDSWRGNHRGVAADHFPNLDPGERPYDRNAWFNTQNHDKLSVGIDLKAPGARPGAADCTHLRCGGGEFLSWCAGRSWAWGTKI